MRNDRLRTNIGRRTGPLKRKSSHESSKRHCSLVDGRLQGTVTDGINSKGWINGTYVDANSVLHGYLRAPDGNITTFDAPDAGRGPNQGTFAVKITNHENIVGWYQDASSVYHGFERLKNGTIVEFDAPGTGTGAGFGTEAFDFNSSNTISGWNQDDSGVYHGFLRTP
ncbi:MAG TPA: hypothetical protein VHT03_02110 [Rhizomicrobium sp.]|jgi:hypothetical protein|nr:hypothetical protein [Rhizomicrobium sp.]